MKKSIFFSFTFDASGEKWHGEHGLVLPSTYKLAACLMVNSRRDSGLKGKKKTLLWEAVRDKLFSMSPPHRRYAPP